MVRSPRVDCSAREIEILSQLKTPKSSLARDQNCQPVKQHANEKPGNVASIGADYCPGIGEHVLSEWVSEKRSAWCFADN